MDLLPIFEDDDSYNVSINTGGDQLFEGFSPSLLVFASICCILFMFLGIPGNLLTIIALARCKKVRNATAIFIINLSCSDLLFCCFNLPLAASTFYHKKWVHSDLLCRLFPLFRYGLLAVSLFTILSITLNRYIMIVHPRVYPRIYRRSNLIIMVSSTWIFAFGSLVQTWRGKWGKFGLDQSIGSCSILPSENGKSPKEFLFLMAFALPLCIIILCYARIFYIVRKAALKTQEFKPKVNGSVMKRPPDDRKSVRKGNFASNNENEQVSPQTTLQVSSTGNNCEQMQRTPKTSRVSIEFTISQLATNNHPDASHTCINKFETENLNLIHIDGLNNVETGEESSAHNLNNMRLKDSSNSSEELPGATSNSTAGAQSEEKSSSKHINKYANLKQKRMKDVGPVGKDVSRKKSLANSGASILHPETMTKKDRRLLKMILVIFLSFLICYLPITLTKVLSSIADINFIFIMGYLLVYLTTCYNPIIYVVLGTYRQAYKDLLMCR